MNKEISDVPSGIEGHPKRKEIIDSLLAGESVRSIAARVTPKVHYQALQRYRARHIVPTLKRAGEMSQVLQSVAHSEDGSGKLERTMEVTRAALQDHPVLMRVAAKYARYDRWLQGAEKAEDWRALASLDGAESKALELHARLSGLLDAPQGPQTAVVVIMPHDARDQPITLEAQVVASDPDSGSR